MSTDDVHDLRNYDLTLLFRGDVSIDEIRFCLRSLTSISSEDKFKFEDGDYTGLVELAYPINKVKYARFYSINLKIDVTILPYLQQKLSMMSNFIIRHLVTKIEKEFNGKYIIGENHRDGFSKLVSQEQKYRDVLREFITTKQQ